MPRQKKVPLHQNGAQVYPLTWVIICKENTSKLTFSSEYLFIMGTPFTNVVLRKGYMNNNCME